MNHHSFTVLPKTLSSNSQGGAVVKSEGPRTAVLVCQQNPTDRMGLRKHEQRRIQRPFKVFIHISVVGSKFVAKVDVG